MNLVSTLIFVAISQFVSLERQDQNLYKAFGFIPVVEIEYFSPSPDKGYPENVPFELRFRYARNLSKETLISTADKEFKKMGTDTAQFSDKLAGINQSYTDVGKSDRYRLAYDPDKGTQLFFNEELVFRTPGHDFAKFYFSIWLKDGADGAQLKR